MSDEDLRNAWNAARAAWERAMDEARQKDALRKARFTTLSGEPVPAMGLPNADGPNADEPASIDAAQAGRHLEQLGFPGQYPYTRGVYPTMYRGRAWTMRQFAGFGTAAETNARYHYLLEHGQTGLSVAFDMPTLMGLDSDHPRSLGEVGRCGVAVSSLEDMERLFQGIPLGKVSTSMTINGPAAIVLAYYLAVARKQGADWKDLRGTTQNDILKEYIAQKEFIFPPEPSMRLVTDTVRFCADQVPQWHAISVSGYHIREAGSTAVQELAFTLADGFAYVEAVAATGMDVDAFAPRLSFFFNSHSDFFEEIAKFRAARRIYARRMRGKYGAKDPRSWQLRFHTQTAGCSLTAQEPENNIVRTAFQALAGVLGGTQSLHTNSMDETLALPTEKSVRIALRTQQVLLEETGVADHLDPLGGSWLVEAMTDRMEQGAEEYFRRIDELGGVVPAIEQGFFQREIGEAAYRYQREFERGERVMVGVNKHAASQEDEPIPILKIGAETERRQTERVQTLRGRRDAQAVQTALERVRATAASGENVMPALVNAALAYATLGETVDALKAVFGVYREPVML